MSSRFRFIVAIGLVAGLFTASFSVMAQDTSNDVDISPDHQFEIHGFDFRSPEFYNVWERTDKPVLDGDVERSWLWGPRANTEVFEEPYVEADDGMREVQYGDKSRMEMPVPGSAAAADEDSPWAITQGLLAIELMTGNLQIGDNTFVPFPPAEIPVAGDWENNPGPTYADMGVYMDWDARNTGATITQYLDDDGHVQDDDRFADYDVYDRYYISQTDHNIASVFWDFMQSEGLVYEDGTLTNGPLFLDEFYAIGFPVTEAYWGEFRLQGEVQDILIQCFERRCLTFAPDNEPAWQVESGNVGLHYHEWRYNIIGDPIVLDPVLSLALDPVDATNVVSTDHTITVTLMEDGTALAISDAADVSITVARGDNDDHDVNETTTVNGAGVASITYTGPAEPTVDTIDVTVSHNGEDVTATATKAWVLPDQVYAVELGQDHDVNLTGTPHTFTATLTESDNPHTFAEGDVDVSIERDSAAVDPINGLTIDVTDNIATITYLGPDDAAVDTIDVSVFVNDTEVVGAPTLTKTWCEGVVEDGDSIQDAVDEATEGDTICVLAGTYNEDVVVDKSLTLLGAQADVDARDRTAADESEIIGSVNVTSSATDFTINGFTLTGTGAVPLAGVNLQVASNNSTVSNNIVNAVEATGGYSNAGFFSFVSIDNATVYQNSFTGALDLARDPNVILVNVATGTVTIEANEMTNVGGGNGIVLINATGTANILDNFIDNTGDNGLYQLAGTLAALNVTGNTFINNDETGIKLGASATTSDISSNNIFGNTVFGVQNQSGVDVNALNNWWGDNSGPFHATDNPTGTGDNVSDDVDFDPWKDDGAF